ncbi:MAG: hypothetical protein HY074_18340, partial [Deltaproteobacteria bacterium]|nr:hypothetical protein [Deltaproteobacteria bacterium]
MLTALDLDKVFKRALQNGGEFAEAFYENTTSNQIYYEDKRVDRILSGVDSGVGLRIIYGGQSVYGYTTELTAAGLVELADTLSKVVAGKLTSTGAISFEKIKPGLNYKILKDPAGLALKNKLEYVDRANTAAWAACKDIKQVTAGYIETLRRIEVANSLGHLGEDQKQYLTFYAQLVGERD